MKENKKQEIPELKCWSLPYERNPEKEGLSHQLYALCDHCGKFHLHGGSKKDNVPGQNIGHRLSHCSVRNAPYDKHGYFLIYQGPLTSEIKKAYPELGPKRCRRCGHEISRIATTSENPCSCGWYPGISLKKIDKYLPSFGRKKENKMTYENIFKVCLTDLTDIPETALTNFFDNAPDKMKLMWKKELSDKDARRLRNKIKTWFRNMPFEIRVLFL